MSAVGESESRDRTLVSRLEFETLLTEISSRFINLDPADVDREIDDVLQQVCGVLDVDYAVLWQWSDATPPVISPSHSYPPMRGPSTPDALDQDAYPWTVGEMLAGRMVVAATLDDLPDEAALDRENARKQGLISNLTVPLRLASAPPLGALAFNSLGRPRDWPTELVQRLQLVAQIFTNALARARHELKLQESEERLSLAADSADAGLWILDYSTGTFWATPRARAVFGYGPDDIIDLKRFEASVCADDWNRVKAAIERSALNGDPVDVEYRILSPGRGDGDDPDVRWIASRGRSRVSPTGEPACLTGISIDITGRMRSEETLRTTRARLEASAELVGFGIYEVDFQQGGTVIDDRLRDIFGLPPDRLHGLQPLEFWMERLHDEDRPRVMEMRRQLHDGSVNLLSIEYRYEHPSSGERWFHHLARVAARNKAGRTLKSYGVIQDVTDRRRAVDELRQSYEEIARLKDQLQAESDYLQAEMNVVLARGEVSGQSAAVRKVLRQVEQVATTDATVLIQGETGSGKELIAQTIHQASARRSRVMVKINCAALPSGLVESELFGREKGAFTGALTRQVGRFEIADGSTLFLDEVGELPPDVQVKLLRVLQEGEFERLGSSRTVKVNVRLIAATNRDLAEEIRKGRFREDLYYRLNVFPIRMPPLRERREDIPGLVWTFLEECASRMGKKITQVPRKTMDVLQSRPWPGNVRELRNVIEYAAIVTTGDTLTVPMPADAPMAGRASQTLAEVERQHICRVLESTLGHIKGPNGAAAVLGLNPATLYSRMKKLGIRPAPQTPAGS